MKQFLHKKHKNIQVIREVMKEVAKSALYKMMSPAITLIDVPFTQKLFRFLADKI